MRPIYHNWYTLGAWKPALLYRQGSWQIWLCISPSLNQTLDFSKQGEVLFMCSFSYNNALFMYFDDDFLTCTLCNIYIHFVIDY